MKEKDNKKTAEKKEKTIKKIMDYRRVAKKIEKELMSSELTEEEVREKKETIHKLRNAISNLENNELRDHNKGMYLGLSVNLRDPSDNEVVPKYLSWDKITNHVGVIGASGVGKTILMLSNIKDTINKGWNSIVIDPKGGNGQEVVNATVSFAKEKGILKNTYYLSPAMPQNSFLINPCFGQSNTEIATSIRDMMMGEKTEQFYGDITYKTVLAILTCFEFIEKNADPDGEIAKTEVDNENKKHEIFIKTSGFNNRYDSENQIVEGGLIDKITGKEDVYMDVSGSKDIVSIRTLVTYKDIAKKISHDELTKLKEKVENEMIDVDSPYRAKLESMKEEALFIIEDTLRQEKEFFSKVSTSLSTLLTKLSAGEVGEIFCKIRTNPLMVKLLSEEQFILIVQPFPTRFGDISNTIVKLILKQLSTLFGNVGSTERIINRIAIFIDETGVALYNGVEDLYNKARGLGGTLFNYTQSYQDYYAALGPVKGKIVLDSINTTIRMRVNDIESAKTVVEELSTYSEFNSTTVAHTGVASENSRVIIQKTEKEILNATDVTLIPVGRGIVKNDREISLVDFAHYGKIYSDIKFNTNNFFKEMDRQIGIH